MAEGSLLLKDCLLLNLSGRRWKQLERVIFSSCLILNDRIVNLGRAT